MYIGHWRTCSLNICISHWQTRIRQPLEFKSIFASRLWVSTEFSHRFSQGLCWSTWPRAGNISTVFHRTVNCHDHLVSLNHFNSLGVSSSSLFDLIGHLEWTYAPDLNSFFFLVRKRTTVPPGQLWLSTKTKFRQRAKMDVKVIIHLHFDCSPGLSMLTTHDGSTVICLAYKAVSVF